MPNVEFCEGCPFANGVQEAGQVWVRGFSSSAPNPGFDIVFTDKNDSNLETRVIDVVPPHSGMDGSWPTGTTEAALSLIDACDSPVEKTRKRLGGILGSTTVKRCGAFPDQKPTHVRMVAIDTGWFHIEDFD